MPTFYISKLSARDRKWNLLHGKKKKNKYAITLFFIYYIKEVFSLYYIVINIDGATYYVWGGENLVECKGCLVGVYGEILIGGVNAFFK